MLIIKRCVCMHPQVKKWVHIYLFLAFSLPSFVLINRTIKLAALVTKCRVNKIWVNQKVDSICTYYLVILCIWCVCSNMFTWHLLKISCAVPIISHSRNNFYVFPKHKNNFCMFFMPWSDGTCMQVRKQ